LENTQAAVYSLEREGGSLKVFKKNVRHGGGTGGTVYYRVMPGTNIPKSEDCPKGVPPVLEFVPLQKEVPQSDEPPIDLDHKKDFDVLLLEALRTMAYHHLSGKRAEKWPVHHLTDLLKYLVWAEAEASGEPRELDEYALEKACGRMRKTIFRKTRPTAKIGGKSRPVPPSAAIAAMFGIDSKGNAFYHLPTNHKWGDWKPPKWLEQELQEMEEDRQRDAEERAERRCRFKELQAEEEAARKARMMENPLR
jgi:hypothetical protein